MRTLIIGAEGQLGSDLRRVLPGEAIGVDLPAIDVRQEAQVQAVLQAHSPDQVINCAAQTNVDRCELEPAEAFATNALGAMYVAKAAAEVGAGLTLISTDYVFGGVPPRGDAYAEDDLPGPLNVYGASKLAGEHLTLAGHRRALVVRTCGLYGHAGARGKGGNFVHTMLRLAREGKPIRVVNDQRISPTSAVECAAKIVALLERHAVGLYHVAAADSCTWYDFAAAIFAEAGLGVDLQPVSSAEYPLRACRPALSALRSVRLTALGVPPCRSWREMLREYLATRTSAAQAAAHAPASCVTGSSS